MKQIIQKLLEVKNLSVYKKKSNISKEDYYKYFVQDKAKHKK